MRLGGGWGGQTKAFGPKATVQVVPANRDHEPSRGSDRDPAGLVAAANRADERGPLQPAAFAVVREYLLELVDDQDQRCGLVISLSSRWASPGAPARVCRDRVRIPAA